MARQRQRNGETRARVADMLGRGVPRAEIADRLGISKPTVTYHAKRLGFDADERFANRLDWDAIQLAYNEGASVRECERRFGFSSTAWNNAVKRGDIRPRPQEMPIDALLVTGRRTGRGHLKKRLIAAGLKENRCERCGLTEWEGESITMHLHHVNGDGRDNRIENLQFLCPNCHSQTDTYGGRNGHRRRARHEPVEERR